VNQLLLAVSSSRLDMLLSYVFTVNLYILMDAGSLSTGILSLLCSNTVLILFIQNHGHHLLKSRGEGDNAIEYVHLIPLQQTHHGCLRAHIK
jgi:hypothetical protein